MDLYKEISKVAYELYEKRGESRIIFFIKKEKGIYN
jgi:hypothetical protein